MRVPGLPSLTAMAVAGARFAGRLPPSSISGRAVRVATAGFVEHVTLRSFAIDAAIRQSVIGDGVDQLVMLGAGLDLRASAMPELADVVVFEVDHPATQRFKRRVSARLSGRQEPARDVRFVGVDFERDDLGACLERAGHDPSRPTFWVWEGVTLYLTERAIHGTLGILSSRSSTGSTLAMTYGTLGLRTDRAFPQRLLVPLLELIGEPFDGLFETAVVCDLVAAYGFRVRVESGAREWARQAGVPPPRVVFGERLIVARRGDGAASAI